MGFPEKNSFIAEYLYQIHENDLPKTATWLFENAKNMNKAMFFGPENWSNLQPEQVLALRAVTPNGVFDSTAEAGYLTKVGGNPALVKLSEVLFKDDYYFINNLPEEYKKELRPQLLMLMKLAYTHQIRPANSSVRNM
jgi:hypothetical protein